MEQLKYEGVTVDRCSACEGIWLDYGELRQIAMIHEEQFTREELEAAMETDADKMEESTALCPRCGMSMEKREIQATVIDVCPQRDGLWLDRGELERVQIRWEQEEKVREERRGMMEQVVRFLVAAG
jgi:Zn-finger nucleic acid-binding protein